MFCHHKETRRDCCLLYTSKLGTDPYGERLLGHRLEDALSGPMSCNWGLIEGDAQHLWVKLNSVSYTHLVLTSNVWSASRF